MTEYRIDRMRFIRATGKVAERNPDRFGTVYGVFYNTKGDKLSIVQKSLTMDDVKAAETVIDIEQGILIIPSGERGRKAVAGLSQDDLNAELAAIRKASK